METLDGEVAKIAARDGAGARTLSVATGDRSFQVDLQLDPAVVTRELAIGRASCRERVLRLV